MNERKGSASKGQHAEGSLSEFLKELQRRRVIRVGLVYVVAAWLIIQVADVTFPNLGLPQWTVTLVVVLCVLGFPIAVILSWAYRIEAEQADPTATSVQYVIPEKRRVDFVIIAALTLAVVILAYEAYFRPETADAPIPSASVSSEPGSESPSDTTPRPSIGVLPFLNLSDDKENEYFADGLAEEILNLLVRVRELDVAARTSSFFYKGKDVDIRTVATQLGVSTVLEGSVRRQDDRIRVTAQLIEAETGFHLWSETYEEKMEDVFEIQDDIAQQVVNAVGALVSSESRQALTTVPTENFEAYEAYLRGMDLVRNGSAIADFESARGYFQRALLLDPNYSSAYAGLCLADLALYQDTRSTGHFEDAEKACNRGLTLDAINSDVNRALGSLYQFSGQYDKAETEFRRAIALNNRDMIAYFGLATTFESQGEVEEAEATFKRALAIQPGYHRAHSEIGNFYYYQGRNSEAIDEYQQALALAPNDASVLLNLGAAYFLEGRFDQATNAWNRSVQLRPAVTSYMNLGSGYFFLERFEEAAAMYEKAIAEAPEDFEAWGSLGDALSFIPGREEDAAAAYAKAIELGDALYAINQSDAMVLAPLSSYVAHSGDAERARDLIETAVSLEAENIYVHYFASITYLAIGEEADAAASLKAAIELGYPKKLVSKDRNLSKLVTLQSVAALLD